MHMCADIGVPMAEEKTFLPTQVLSFLGYELDSVKMEVRSGPSPTSYKNAFHLFKNF